MSAIKMRCVDLILVYLIGVVACRPQNIENIEARTVTAAPGVETATKIILVPFYGGGKGQSLQITENAKGEVISSVIIKTPSFSVNSISPTEHEIDPAELENPPLPSNFDTEYLQGYDLHLKNIQHRSGEIVKLQNIAKEKGELTEDQENKYQEHMTSINESAKKLAESQGSEGLSFENREGLSQWFERKKEIGHSKEKKKKEEEKMRRKETEDKEAEEADINKKEIKKNQKEEGGEEEGVQQPDDGVAINLPPEDASVAEAKPVGLAVAGAGGVAASKPIATAVVGPGGLAIARPVATAIAGVSPDQALVPIYAEGLVSSSHKKNGNRTKTDQMSEFLNKIISKYHQT